jgi:hypothetical protein
MVFLNHRKTYAEPKELTRIVKEMPLMKDEDQAVTKFLKPMLEKSYFVKTSVRLDWIHSTLKTEGALTPEEINVKHPFHPDIDILFWLKKYTGEPLIHATEVKYFRLKKGIVYPNIYEGIGEACMLLTFGVDYVNLWHLFDPEISSETISRYRDITQSLVNEANLPINYQSWVLPEPSTEGPLSGITREFQLSASLSLLALKINPLRNRWDTMIIRSIIKKRYRIISQT